MIPRFRLIIAVPLALAAGLFVYGSLLLRAPALERDDQALLSPLAAIAGPADYISSLRTARILDVAPVRDLSFALDLRLGRALGAPTFTLTNLLLWLALVSLALTLFRALGFGDAVLWALLLVLVAHPVYAVSVAWISSRKHLLAGVFLLGATVLLVRRPAKKLAAAALYALSVLSHPIHLLWPLWAWAYLACSREKRPIEAAISLWPSLVVMGALGAVNAWYYATVYETASGGLSKFSAESGPGITAMALGRAVFNLAVPYALSPVDYFPGSAKNIAGLLLAPLLFLALAKLIPWRTLLPWALFLALPLLLLNVRATRVFLSDTYLLVPSLGLWVIAARALEGRARLARAAAIALAVLAVPGLLATRALASSFSSMERLFDLAYEREPTPQVTAVHARDLFERGRFREAAELSFAVIPEFPSAEIIYAQAIARDPALSVDGKLALLRKAPGREPLTHYFVARTLADGGRYGEAYREISPGLSRLGLFGDQAPAVAREAMLWADKAGMRSPALDAAIKAQLGGKP